MTRGQLFIISAPSGAGKSTVLKSVLAELEAVAFSVSHTTRKPRCGEKNGREYHFVDTSTFKAMIAEDEFLEWAEVHGNYYGTSRKAVTGLLDLGQDVFLDIDVQGMRILKERKMIEGVTIFLAPPSLDELERRLRQRASDDEASIIVRLENARREMLAMSEYDYLLVNNRLQDAVRSLSGIVLAERARMRRDIDGKPLMGGKSA